MGSEQMNDEQRVFGGSLAVDNVQVLAAQKLKEIPNRYIRSELEFEVVSIDLSNKIPVIDLGKLLDKQFRRDEMAKLHSACEDWGFFQLINHGACEEIIQKMKTNSHEFFKLPLEEKKTYANLPSSNEGYGQAFVVSEEQKLDWADMFFITALPLHERIMRFWPNNPTSFRATLDKYSLELQRVTISLAGFMANNLGVEPEKWTNMLENGSQGITMNYYPTCPHAHKVIGLSPHSDACAITLLIQVNEVEGLQIRKNGNWVPIKPIAGAFIVNIGDTMEILSNGKYMSNEHRAVIHPQKERISVAAFHRPNLSAMIGPLSELVKESGKHYKTIIFLDYLKHYFASKLDGKSALDLIKLDN